ncbi:MAG: hypothetical protein IPP25_20525 [Saprospiraceae bacterium]|nr:hypothetical protein [Candidatus Opimibacter skivensis]
MKVFFDKPNFIQFSLSVDKSEGGKDVLRMVKNQLDIHFNFNQVDLNEEESILLEEFFDGINEDKQLTYGEDAIQGRPLTRDSFPSKCGIYLLEDENINRYRDEHSLLIGSVGEEVQTLKKLIINSDYQFHRQKLFGDDITFESFIDLLALPFSVVYIIDRYLFKGPEIGGNLGLTECNIEKFVKNVLNGKMSPSTFVFVYQVNTHVPKGNQNYDEGPNLDMVARRIRSCAKGKCPRPAVVLIGIQSGIIEDEHDRHIISDYVRIKSGDSFVYYLSNGQKKTASLGIDYYSLAYLDNRKSNKALLTKLRQMIIASVGTYPQFSRFPEGIDINTLFEE